MYYAPSQQLHPACPPEQRYLSTYQAAYPAREKKKGTCSWWWSGKGREGGNHYLPKKTVQIPKRFLARRRLLQQSLTFTAPRCPRLQPPLSPTSASHCITAASRINESPPRLHETLCASIQFSQWLTRMFSSLTPPPASRQVSTTPRELHTDSTTAATSMSSSLAWAQRVWVPPSASTTSYALLHAVSRRREPK